MCLSPPISTPTVPTLTLHNPLPFWRLLEAASPDPAAFPSVRLLAELDAAEAGEDFGNRLDEWYAEANSVEVRDTGEGMSLDDLTHVFLRLGTKSRHDETRLGGRNLGDTENGRRSALRQAERTQSGRAAGGESV